MVLVFQYGSNTDPKRLNSGARLRNDATPIGITYTEGNFELDFTVWSKTNNCAAADIIPGSGRKIWGVLYEIPDYLIQRSTAKPFGRKSLDEIEGEGSNYERITIALKYQDGFPVEKKAITYVVLNRRRNLQTNFEYVKHILNGLREHKIPDEYIEYVKGRVVVNNPSLKQEIDLF